MRLINGPEAFTPDGEFVLNPTDVRGFWVAGYFRAQASPARAEWGSSSPSGSSKGRRASTSGTWTRAASAPRTRAGTTRSARTTEVYSRTTMTSCTPGRSGRRPAPRLSPVYPRLQELGAVRREVGLGTGELVRAERRRRRREPAAARWAGRHWSPAIGAEHRACREAAALFDESSSRRSRSLGRALPSCSSGLCDNRVARDVGAITYTQMLNGKAGSRQDFTVTRLAEDRFRIVTGTAFGRHDLAWIRQHAPDDGFVRVDDVTSSYACIGIWGRRAARSSSRRPTCSTSGTCGRASSGRAGALPGPARRHLRRRAGWEFYRLSEFGLRLWDEPGRAGAAMGSSRGGYKAIDSLRLEKGYRVWGSDITADDTPDEAGLGFAVKRDKDFGKEALVDRGGPGRRLACLTLADPRAVALGSEPVRVGEPSSAGSRAAATATWSRARSRTPTCRRRAEPGTAVEVEIFGEWVRWRSPPSRSTTSRRAAARLEAQLVAGAGRRRRRRRRARRGRRGRGPRALPSAARRAGAGSRRGRP